MHTRPKASRQGCGDRGRGPGWRSRGAPYPAGETRPEHPSRPQRCRGASPRSDDVRQPGASSPAPPEPAPSLLGNAVVFLATTGCGELSEPGDPDRRLRSASSQLSEREAEGSRFRRQRPSPSAWNQRWDRGFSPDPFTWHADEGAT